MNKRQITFYKIPFVKSIIFLSCTKSKIRAYPVHHLNTLRSARVKINIINKQKYEHEDATIYLYITRKKHSRQQNDIVFSSFFIFLFFFFFYGKFYR